MPSSAAAGASGGSAGGGGEAKTADVTVVVNAMEGEAKVPEKADVVRALKRLNSYDPDHHTFHIARRFGRVFVAGAGFLADSYDIFVINIALMMMKQNDYGVPLTHDIQASVSLMTIVGALTGQILFGLMGDQFGRKWTFISTAVLTIFGTILQACAQPRMMGLNIWQQMMVFRFLMGVGIGGEYPMASTVTSESSRPEDRGRNGVGRVLCALVLLLSAYVIKDTNWQWRFAILFGAVPMLACLRFRWLPESQVFHEDVEKVPPMQRAFAILQTVYENRFKLLGTAGSWFILDVVFYGNSLFSADVTVAMGTENTLKSQTQTNLWIQLMAMPGYICSIFFLDAVGRKRLQMLGFAGEAIVFGIMAIFYASLKNNLQALFVIMYALTFFFDDFGPNTTTFIIPSEIFPTQSRATCHGISAAFGKAGAALGGFLFFKASNYYCDGRECTKQSPESQVDKGIRLVFICCAALAVLGLGWTWFLVDDTPHESLARAKEVYDEVEEAPGEVEALEDTVLKGIELGVVTPLDDGHTLSIGRNRSISISTLPPTTQLSIRERSNSISFHPSVKNIFEEGKDLTAGQ